MIRKETITFYYEHCGDCPYPIQTSEGKEKCRKKNRIIPDVWEEIPDWCPLEVKGE